MTDKPDPTPRTVTTSIYLTGYAFRTTHAGQALVLEFNRDGEERTPERIVIPWAGGAPMLHGACVTLTRSETESEANHRAQVELNIAMRNIMSDDALQEA